MISRMDLINSIAQAASSDLRLILEIVGAIVAALMGVFGGREIQKRKQR